MVLSLFGGNEIRGDTPLGWAGFIVQLPAKASFGPVHPSGKRNGTYRFMLLILCMHAAVFRFEDIPGQEQCRISKGKGRNATSLSPTELALLWGVDQAVFEAGVMKRTVTAGGTSASVDLNAAQVGEAPE